MSLIQALSSCAKWVLRPPLKKYRFSERGKGKFLQLSYLPLLVTAVAFYVSSMLLWEVREMGVSKLAKSQCFLSILNRHGARLLGRTTSPTHFSLQLWSVVSFLGPCTEFGCKDVPLSQPVFRQLERSWWRSDCWICCWWSEYVLCACAYIYFGCLMPLSGARFVISEGVTLLSERIT